MPLQIKNAPEDQDLELIHGFLSRESTWAKGISKERVRESIQNSLSFGLFEGEDQVAYGRVVTDYATFAYVLDVFVLQKHRGKGYSRLLMDAIVSHPRLQGLRRMVLVSSNARGLYSKFGFEALRRPETYMEIFCENAYQPDSRDLVN